MRHRIGALALLAGAALTGGVAVPSVSVAADTLAIVGIVGRSGVEPGQLSNPVDVTLDAAANPIVADSGNNRIQKFARDGSLLWVAGRADRNAGDGNGEFSNPKDVAVARDGTVLVADDNNRRVVRLAGATGAFLTSYDVKFGPQGISVDQADGSIYLADSFGARIVKLNANGVVVGSFGSHGKAPGQFSNPFDVSAAGGFVYVADSGNSRVQRFRTNGAFVRAWGKRPTDQEHPKAGEMVLPNGISATAAGRVFVVDKTLALVDDYTVDGRLRERFSHKRLLENPGGLFAQGDDLAIADTGHGRVLLLTHALAPPAGAFCDSATGTCEPGPNGVPSVTMRGGDRSDVHFVTPSDACVRLGRGGNLGKDAFFNGRKYAVARVAEGYQVTIPAADLVSGSAIISWRCPVAGAARARAAGGLSFSVVNENVGDVTLYDPSGLVLDARTGAGIADATVTLQSAPSFSGPFGLADPLSISPRVNPERTDRRGHYGWDVPNGFYRIRVTRFGYRTLRASRVVIVPPPVTNLDVRLRRNPSEQARLLDPAGRVGRLRLGMGRATATRIARGLRPRPRLSFRRDRLVRIETSSRRYRTGAGLGPGSTERVLRLAYGRRARSSRRGRARTYRIGRLFLVVPRADGATGRVGRARVGS